MFGEYVKSWSVRPNTRVVGFEDVPMKDIRDTNWSKYCIPNLPIATTFRVTPIMSFDLLRYS